MEFYKHKESGYTFGFMYKTVDGLNGLAQVPQEGYKVALVTDEELENEFEKIE